MIFSACPPIYTLPGTWSDPDKIAKCNETLIPHFTFNPDYTFGISIAVITILLAGYGVYKGFFANKDLLDPWEDHDPTIFCVLFSYTIQRNSLPGILLSLLCDETAASKFL